MVVIENYRGTVVVRLPLDDTANCLLRIATAREIAYKHSQQGRALAVAVEAARLQPARP